MQIDHVTLIAKDRISYGSPFINLHTDGSSSGLMSIYREINMDDAWWAVTGKLRPLVPRLSQSYTCVMYHHLRSIFNPLIFSWKEIRGSSVPLLMSIYRVAKKKPGTIQSIQSIFRTLLWSTVNFFTLLDRASFPHYNNTKIIKFGWELFILWVISYGLSFSGFARFPEFRGTINDKLMANPENDSP